MNLPKILTQNRPKYEIAQNFVRNFDALHQPGGQSPPAPPPPTPMLKTDQNLDQDRLKLFSDFYTATPTANSWV